MISLTVVIAAFPETGPNTVADVYQRLQNKNVATD